MNQFSAIMLSFLLLACSPIVNHRGHTEKDKFDGLVKIGEDSKADIRARFGSPSSISNYGDETWYFISTRKETTAFFKPEITQQEVTQISFNSEGLVKEMKQYTKADGEQISAVEQTTPTEGHTLGFMEQVFGNLGRFNKDTTTATPPRRPGGH